MHGLRSRLRYCGAYAMTNTVYVRYMQGEHNEAETLTRANVSDMYHLAALESM